MAMCGEHPSTAAASASADATGGALGQGMDDDDAASDDSGATIDLSLPPESEQPTPESEKLATSEKRLSDHLRLSDAAFSPGGTVALHAVRANLESDGLDINAPDDAGYTTLMTCIKHKRRDSALLLLRRNADVLPVNRAGWNSAHLAASLGQLTVLEALVAAAREWLRIDPTTPA